MQTSDEKIHAWQLRAEEYRAAADNVSDPSVKETYRRLAQNYERLAARERIIQKDRADGSGGNRR